MDAPDKIAASIDTYIIALPLPGRALCALLNESRTSFTAHYIGYFGPPTVQLSSGFGNSVSSRRSVSIIAPQGRPPLLEAALQILMPEKIADSAVSCQMAQNTVLLTAATRTAEITRAVQVGISVFLDEAEEPEQLFAAIYAAVRGAFYSSPDLAESVRSLASVSKMTEPIVHKNGMPKLDVIQPHLTILTPREREVVILITKGYSDAEAARELFVSPKTVNSHLKAVYQKLNICRRTQLASFVR